MRQDLKQLGTNFDLKLINKTNWQRVRCPIEKLKNCFRTCLRQNLFFFFFPCSFIAQILLSKYFCQLRNCLSFFFGGGCFEKICENLSRSRINIFSLPLGFYILSRCLIIMNGNKLNMCMCVRAWVCDIVELHLELRQDLKSELK